MPGLVKVGKMTRQPSERASELSGVTGVATPFIVVYEDHFPDCDAAEIFVHTQLASAGLRLSDNREFFRASVSDVVKIIATMHSKLPGHSSTNDRHDDLLTPDDSEFASFNLEESCKSEPWEAILEEADKHYYGLEGYIEDHPEAFKLYRDAARLGSPNAFERIGDMYRAGEGVKEDAQKALDFYKEGAKAGNYFCYGGMALIFLPKGHLENARKALRKMIAGGEAENWEKYRDYGNRHIRLLHSALFDLSFRKGCFDNEMMSISRAYLPEIVVYIREKILGSEWINKYPTAIERYAEQISILQIIIGVPPAPPPMVR